MNQVPWLHEVRRALLWLAQTRPVLTADDVWAAMEGELEGFEPRSSGDDPGRRQGLGSVMRSMAKTGVIERTGMVQASTRGVRHSGNVAIWRSRVYQPVVADQ